MDIRNIINLLERAENWKVLSDDERHDYLEFIHNWLTGHYMKKGSDDAALRLWIEIGKLFPPKVSGMIKLFRLVTLPIEFAEKKSFSFRPANGSVSSWTSKKVGLDNVAGVAADTAGDENPQGTCRIAVSCNIDSHSIIATPQSMTKAFLTLSHDYFDSFQEKQVSYEDPEYGTVFRTEVPNWPKTTNKYFDIHEVDYLMDVMKRAGGYMRQYEYIVRTPNIVDAEVVRIYRVGSKVIRYGNDDPHN